MCLSIPLASAQFLHFLHCAGPPSWVNTVIYVSIFGLPICAMIHKMKIHHLNNHSPLLQPRLNQMNSLQFITTNSPINLNQAVTRMCCYGLRFQSLLDANYPEIFCAVSVSKRIWDASSYYAVIAFFHISNSVIFPYNPTFWRYIGGDTDVVVVQTAEK